MAGEQLVFDHALDAGFAQAVDERAHFLFMLDPRAAQRGQIRKLIGRQQRRRRLPAPSRVPRPLRRVDVRHRVANRFEAAAQIPAVLLGGQRLQRVEQPIARPVVVIDHRLQVLEIHGMTLTWLRRSSRGNSRSRYALPPSNSVCCLPARMPPPAVSPYSLLSAPATSMPSTTSPNGTNPWSS